MKKFLKSLPVQIAADIILAGVISATTYIVFTTMPVVIEKARIASVQKKNAEYCNLETERQIIIDETQSSRVLDLDLANAKAQIDSLSKHLIKGKISSAEYEILCKELISRTETNSLKEYESLRELEFDIILYALEHENRRTRI